MTMNIMTINIYHLSPSTSDPHGFVCTCVVFLVLQHQHGGKGQGISLGLSGPPRGVGELYLHGGVCQKGPMQMPGAQCLQCLTPSHDSCDMCLLACLTFQQHRAIRLYIFNLEPQLVANPDSGMTMLVLHSGSVGKAQQWLANWTVTYLAHKAMIPGPVSDTIVVSGETPQSRSSSSQGTVSGQNPPPTQGDVGEMPSGLLTLNHQSL